MTFGMNKILIGFSSTAAAVFGVYYKLQSFVFMPVFGLNNGMVPILSYNYGARRKKRITGTIKLAVLYAVIIMAAGVLLFQLLPAQLMALFDASEAMQRWASPRCGSSACTSSSRPTASSSAPSSRPWATECRA